MDLKISIATVYRTVRLFEEANILEKHDFGDGRSRYEEIPESHHDHLIDIESGQVIEFRNEQIEALQRAVAEQLGYRIVDHRLEIWRGADQARRGQGQLAATPQALVWPRAGRHERPADPSYPCHRSDVASPLLRAGSRAMLDRSRPERPSSGAAGLALRSQVPRAGGCAAVGPGGPATRSEEADLNPADPDVILVK